MRCGISECIVSKTPEWSAINNTADHSNRIARDPGSEAEITCNLDDRASCHSFQLGRGLNCEHSAKVFSRCWMKMPTLVDVRRLAGRTARIGTVRSKAVRRRMTVPSLSSAAKSHAGAWAIPRCSRTPIRICSRSLVRKTPVGITRFTPCGDPKLHGCTEPRSTKTTERKRRRSSGDSGVPCRVRY